VIRQHLLLHLRPQACLRQPLVSRPLPLAGLHQRPQGHSTFGPVAELLDGLHRFQRTTLAEARKHPAQKCRAIGRPGVSRKAQQRSLHSFARSIVTIALQFLPAQKRRRPLTRRFRSPNGPRSSRRFAFTTRRGSWERSVRLPGCAHAARIRDRWRGVRKEDPHEHRDHHRQRAEKNDTGVAHRWRS
jgi:hypothetical protein